TSIMGWTDLVLETDLTDDQREHLQIVRRSADDLFTLLSDILDLATLTTGGATLVTGDVLPHLLVAQAADGVRARAAAKELALRTHVDPAVPRVLRGDAERLRHVLRHLLDNAVKFTNHGEVTVNVTKEEAGKGQVHLRFAVHDTGIGITEADWRRLFQPFTQGDSSHSRHYMGAGMGLAIVRHLVDLMGGEVELESVVGQGSTFSFTVPLALTGSGSS
ncbi:MAG TPA: ATP-binding protein, partial [Herpetosiphonaceae bacterium]|nr:ATP-binding protein [Herpetosiphonaceae bacterium]